MGTAAIVSLGGYFLVLNERWKKEVKEETTMLSRFEYIAKECLSLRLNDWVTYLKFLAVGAGVVVISNQFSK